MIPEEPEEQRREKTAKPAHGPDKTCHDTRVVRKVLGNEFENGPVAETEQKRTSQRPHRERQH